jgi:catechol 2,3-dioxygenase-like lactoylglutathione lyase family enzyme
VAGRGVRVGNRRLTPLAQSLSLVALLVRDYDEAIAWYTGTLGWTLRADEPREAGKRWVVVAPAESGRPALLLARAATDEQRAQVGRQAGGRVAFFLETDDLARDHAAWTARGVAFTEAPRDEPYGRVVVFRDLYGNRWDLIEPARG